MNNRIRFHLLFAVLINLLFNLPLSAQTLYWLDASLSTPIIGKSSPDGSNVESTVLGDSSLPEAIDFSFTQKKIYWSELKFDSAGIHGIDTGITTDSPLFSDVSALRGIAIDNDSNWIYFASSNLQTKPEINRVHPDGTGKELVIALDSITGNPRALAIDKAARTLYWTEFTKGTIERIYLDSAAVPQTIIAGLSGPVGLAVDHSAGTLYWAEANSKTIRQCDLDGSFPYTILYNLGTPNYLTIDGTGGVVYWTEIDTPCIRKALLSGASVETLPITVSHPTGIRFVSLQEAALPVELTAFHATAVKNAVTLTWNTATEVNNYGFEIERRAAVHPEQVSEVPSGQANASKDGGWNKVGFVEGHGTTNAPKEYSYTDKATTSGKYSYRLKQIDRDGKFTYSQSVEVTISSTPTVFALDQNYPNPFNPTTTIAFQLPASGLTMLTVYDVLGREVAELVNEVKGAGNYSIPFDATKLSSGVYLYSLRAGSNVVTKKLLVLK